MTALHAIELTRTRGECAAMAFAVREHLVFVEGSAEPAGSYLDWTDDEPVGTGRDPDSGLIACIAALDDACRARRLLLPGG